LSEWRINAICVSRSSISAVLVEHEAKEESHHGGFVFCQNLGVENIFAIGFYVGG
jgi:hypothetical protein